MGDGFGQAALILVCLGLVLCASVNAQDTVAKQSDQPAEVAQEDTSACGCNSCGCDPCGPCGVGGYGAGGYGAGGYGAGGYGAGGGAGGAGSFDAFGAAGGAGAAAPGAGAAPYMIGDLLMANRVIQFQYARCGSFHPPCWEDPGAGGAPGYYFPVSVEGGAVVNIRNTKVAENNNAIPTDRFAYEYNFFKNGMSITGIDNQLFEYDENLGWKWLTKKADYDVDVHTFTYEKTFWCGAGSVEVRMPFARSLSSSLDLKAGELQGTSYYEADPADPLDDWWALEVCPTPEDTLGEQGWELMDMSMILKFLLHYDPCRERYIAAGLQLVAPTARDINVSVTDYWGWAFWGFDWSTWDEWVSQYDTSAVRNRNFHIENETWALSPFLAMTSKPTPRTFFNGFLQVDIPLNSNTVVFNQAYGHVVATEEDGVLQMQIEDVTDLMGVDSDETGKVADQTLLHLDVALGYYLYMDPCACLVKAVVPTAEVHLTQTLSDPDRLVLPGSGFVQISQWEEGMDAPPPEPAPVVGNPAGSNTIVDMTVGVHAFLGRASMLSVGGVFPLGDGWDRTFDSEIAVKFNHAF